MTSKYDENKLYVSNIPKTLNSKKLRAYFERFGVVTSAVVVMGSQKYKSSLYGFISFSSKNTLEEVLSSNHKIEGKEVTVERISIATDTQKLTALAKGRPDNLYLFVQDLPKDTNCRVLVDYFSQFGMLKSVHLFRAEKKARDYVLLQYFDLESIALAKSLKHRIINLSIEKVTLVCKLGVFKDHQSYQWFEEAEDLLANFPQASFPQPGNSNQQVPMNCEEGQFSTKLKDWKRVPQSRQNPVGVPNPFIGAQNYSETVPKKQNPVFEGFYDAQQVGPTTAKEEHFKNHDFQRVQDNQDRLKYVDLDPNKSISEINYPESLRDKNWNHYQETVNFKNSNSLPTQFSSEDQKIPAFKNYSSFRDQGHQQEIYSDRDLISFQSHHLARKGLPKKSSNSGISPKTSLDQFSGKPCREREINNLNTLNTLGNQQNPNQNQNNPLRSDKLPTHSKSNFCPSENSNSSGWSQSLLLEPKSYLASSQADKVVTAQGTSKDLTKTQRNNQAHTGRVMKAVRLSDLCNQAFQNYRLNIGVDRNQRF